MRFGYANDLVQRYPSLRAGVLCARGLHNGPAGEAVEALLAEAEATVMAGIPPEAVSSHPHIAAWRTAYSAFGVKPSRYNCAVELLVRRVLKEGKVPRINSLVDLCNAVSLSAVLPVAVYDLERLAGDVEVRFARGDERFRPLGAPDDERPEPGEVIYADREEAVSRRWNWRQCEKARVSEQTRAVLITTEGVVGVPAAAVEQAIGCLAELIPRHCGGVVPEVALIGGPPLAPSWALPE